MPKFYNTLKQKMLSGRPRARLLLVFTLLLGSVAFAHDVVYPQSADAAYHFSNFRASPPIHSLDSRAKAPRGLTPTLVKKIYGLPQDGGQGTIAIIGAYDDPMIEHDLGVFDTQFGLPTCTVQNGCLEKHLLTGSVPDQNAGWSLETSLDIEWAHAIAPRAHILLVETPTPTGSNLIQAIDYAGSRTGVVSVSMSWGGGEFPEETSLESHFIAKNHATFFASSGDSGAGASWPASSPNVVAVGGTTLSLNQSGQVVSETAWQGSGGGVSSYENEPQYQKSYSIAKANGKRAIPDVSYDADPKSGFSVYRSTSKGGAWYMVGGTSAGAPQWAAINALGLSVTHDKIYADKASASNASYFRDITSGSNGTCSYYCDARKHYDYVTGLGSPLTSLF